MAINSFAHGVTYAIRVDTYERMQRLDTTFFDKKETGETESLSEDLLARTRRSSTEHWIRLA